MTDGKNIVSRDDIRGKIFSAESKKPGSEIITMFGSEVEVRQPKISQINSLSRAAADAKTPAVCAMMVEYCYVPGTNDKLFDKGDVDQLADMPTGKWLNDFMEAISKLSGVDIKEAEKNFDETD